MPSFDYIALKFPNLPDFNKALSELSSDLQTKIVRAGANAAGQVFKKGVIQQAPVHQGAYRNRKKLKTPGNLRRNIYVARSRSGSSLGKEVFSVRAREGKKSKTGDAFYWRFVEAGHRKRGAKLTGGRHSRALQRKRHRASAGVVPGVFFFRYAFNALKDAALAAFNARIQARIDLANRQK